MNACHPLLFIILFLFLPLTSFSQENSEVSESREIEQITQSFSVKDQLRRTIEESKEQFSQNPFGLPPGQNEHLMKQFTEAFATTKLWDDFSKAFQQQYQAKYADSIIQWLDSTQHITEKRQDFYTLQGIREQVVSKYELEQNPPSRQRLNSIESLAKAASAEETDVETQAIIFRAYVLGFSKINRQQTFSEAQIDGIVENYRRQISPQVQQKVNSRFLLMFNEVEDDLIIKLTQFHSTEAGHWLQNSIMSATQSALNKASDRFVNAVQS